MVDKKENWVTSKEASSASRVTQDDLEVGDSEVGGEMWLFVGTCGKSVRMCTDSQVCGWDDQSVL